MRVSCCIASGASLRWVLRVVACCAVAGISSRAEAQFRQEDYSQHAVLIGVERYQKATPLQFTENDVRQLADTLWARGGFNEFNIHKFIEGGAYNDVAPTRAAIVEQVPRILSERKPTDRLIVYFSGHGFRDAEGRMYLAPLDADPAAPEATCIPVTWLRDQLAACQAGFKLLVLDACHAGSEKGDDRPTVAAKDLGEPFRDLTGVVTLASSSADEKSLIWGEKEQSLFSYWLNQGLKGHADMNLDGAVDVDELNSYVHRRVTTTAEKRLGYKQTPVRIVRSGTPGVPMVVQLAPTGLNQVLGDMADQMTWALGEQGLRRVGVLEFTADTPLGELLGGEYGLLGKYCAADVERKLSQAAAGSFSVVDRRRIQAAVAESSFSVDQLASGEALKALCEKAGNIDAIVVGTLHQRAGAQLSMSCKLLDVSNDALAATAAGAARLSETDWAMLGKSTAVTREDREPPPADQRPDDYTPDSGLIDNLDRRSKGPHPMQDARFPYRLSLVVNGKQRQPVFRGNEMLVGVRQNEVYELWITIPRGEPVMMQLMVDGLNTLPQEVPGEKGIRTLEIAPRVHLNDARGWVLDPSKSLRYAVRGFVTETGAQGRLREFLVVDSQDSVAARKEFTDQLGLITAAFYEAYQEFNVGAPPPGTGFGRERTQDLEEVKYQRGSLITVLHLRYVDADSPELSSR